MCTPSCSVGDTLGALDLARDGLSLLTPRLDGDDHDLAAMAGSLMLHAALTSARAGSEGDAWRYWDQASALAKRLPVGYFHPWTMFGTANVALHAVSLNADLSKSIAARNEAEQINPSQIPSRQMTAETLDHGGALISQRARELADSISLHL